MNAPTLLIGLGGTGCKIIERVSKMVTGEQRNNIAFAVFDTDINDLRGIQERNPFIKTIQTSTKQTVGEYLNKDTHARDTWFPVNAILNGKTLTEGAGQVRSISRLALETVIRAGKMEPLHEAIQSLYKVEEDKADQALRVVIVSSLAGGTGSGLILPVALYTRNYLQTHFRQSANITRGFFILPEVFYEVITGQTERNNLKANAYATLRELDAFLMKGDATLHERYSNSVRMQFPRAASNGYEEYDVRPYDFCFLFDAQNAEGGKLNSFDQYLDHAANCIYAQSIGPMNKRSNSSEDNTIRKLAKERGRNRYAGAGASMLVYPFEDIRTLIALKWTKQFLHPNAIRYMLIKILDLMKKQKESVDKDRDDNRQYFETFEKNTFDIAETEDVEETVDDLSDRKTSLVSRLTKRPTGEQEEMKRKFKVFFDTIGAYQVQCAQSFVLGQGIDYIESLISAFESFYKSFDSKIAAIDKAINDIYKKYSDSKGTTVRYVCATKECFDKIYEKKPYTGSSISIDSELAKDIYAKVHDYAMRKDKPNNNRYFNDLFDKGIVGYFENVVMRDYGSELDVDVITAIENEADYEGRFEEEDNAYALIDQYVRKVIEDTRKLSCPFIESPMGEAREPIDSCTFNIEMAPEKGDESPRAQLIRKELMNFGGSPDEDIPKNTIMFYQSFYGLRANDLSKFAPPEKSITYNRSSGEYFKAYYELVAGVHPEAHRSKEISPHIDRWWHIITKMPDLDEDNQKKQEYEMYAAFFWAMANRYVYLSEEGSDVRIYKLRNILLDMDDDSLIVSNGTECDKLYEVLDAIAIYPELIQKILSEVETLTINDVNENNALEDGMLFSALRTFRIEEPGVGPENAPSYNIFDLPMLMKKSATTDTYYEANVIEMLRVELEEIKK